MRVGRERERATKRQREKRERLLMHNSQVKCIWAVLGDKSDWEA